MKNFVSFSDQDTALEFNRILRNLERYQIVRDVTGGIRKSNSSSYSVGYKVGRWGARNHVVNLLHSGNGAVRVTIGRIDNGLPEIVLVTVSATDSFLESTPLRKAIQEVCYLVSLKGNTLRGADLVERLGALARVDLDDESRARNELTRACIASGLHQIKTGERLPVPETQSGTGYKGRDYDELPSDPII